MDREEKALEQTLDVLIGKLNDCKSSLGSLIGRLEDDGQSMEPVTWSSALDSFALISSQINLVLRYLKQDSVPNLRNRVLFPIYLNPERDEELAQVTEGRVQSVNHDMVPNYLRTCPEPEIESKEQVLLLRASSMTPDQGVKSISTTNSVVDKVSELVRRWKEEMESETGSGRIVYPPTHKAQDTQMIIAAICNGVGFRPDSKSLIGSLPAPPTPAQTPAPVKATKMIRTKITSTTPYSR